MLFAGDSMQLSLLGILTAHPRPMAQPQHYVCLHLLTLRVQLLKLTVQLSVATAKYNRLHFYFAG